MGRQCWQIQVVVVGGRGLERIDEKLRSVEGGRLEFHLEHSENICKLSN